MPVPERPDPNLGVPAPDIRVESEEQVQSEESVKPKAEKRSKRTMVSCPSCGGRKVISFGASDFPCDFCGQTGEVEG